jgi:hypothetical protein
MGKLRRFMDSLHIIDKEGMDLRLGDVMTPPQADLVHRVETDIADGSASRYIVLKARQIGISTVVEGILFSLAMSRPNFRGLIIAHEATSSEYLLSMSRYYYDSFWGREAFPPRHSATSQLAWNPPNSHIRIATAGNKNAGRSQTLRGLHASEVAFWPVGAEEMMRGLHNTLGRNPQTLSFLESTPNGVGGYYYDSWQRAVAGESDYVPLFYPYWAHPLYTAENIGLSHEAHLSPFTYLDEEEKSLAAWWSKSRRLVGNDYHAMDSSEIKSRLIWRRAFLRTECHGSINTLHQEFPAHPEEAFLATGTNVFDLVQLHRIYEPIDPDRGRLMDNGRGVEFVRDPTGPLEIYIHPARGSWGDYIVGADSKKAAGSVAGRAGDYACAQVISARTWEQCARWRGRIDQNAFGEQLILLGRYYNTALIAPETGIGGAGTVGHIVGRGYPRVWRYRKSTSLPGVVNNNYGWPMTTQTKHEAIGDLQFAIAQAADPISLANNLGLRIHDSITYAELRNYVMIGDGFGNADGEKGHDDTVVSLAIALAVSRRETRNPYDAYAESSSPRTPELEQALRDFEVEEGGMADTHSPGNVSLPPPHSIPSWLQSNDTSLSFDP